jgi:HEAT repeat protein
MGLFDAFSSPEKKIKSLQRKVTERYGPPENRQRAIDQLIELGSAEAISALVMRFTAKAEPSITDEEEKERVFHAIVDFGENSVGPLGEYDKNSEVAVSWALKALGQLVPQENLIALCLETLKRLGPDYTRDPEKKTVLIGQLASFTDPRIAEGLVPFLDDPADEVRIAASNALAQQKDERSREPLLEAMVRADQGKRVIASIADSLWRSGFGVQGFREKVEAVLPEPFFVDKAGIVKKRGA